MSGSEPKTFSQIKQILKKQPVDRSGDDIQALKIYFKDNSFFQPPGVLGDWNIIIILLIGKFHGIHGEFRRIHGKFRRIHGKFHRIHGKFNRIHGKFNRINGNFHRINI